MKIYLVKETSNNETQTRLYIGYKPVSSVVRIEILAKANVECPSGYYFDLNWDRVYVIINKETKKEAQLQTTENEGYVTTLDGNTILCRW